MNILIYTQSYYVRKAFVNALIPFGINVFHGENISEILDKAKERNAEMVVFDVIQENYDEVFPEMAKLKLYSAKTEHKIGVILQIGTADKNYITKALQLGAIGFLKSNAQEDTIANYITQIYEKIKGAPPQRKFARVTLDVTNENERIGIKFRSPNNMQLIMGVIKDISAGGIAVELVGTFEPDALEVGVEVSNIQFILDQRTVDVNAIVVVYQKRFCAFRFSGLHQQDKEIISQFIFERLQEI